MRIEAYTQVQQLYQSKQTVKSQKTGSASRSTDQLQLSTVGKDIQAAKAAVAAAPDTREDLVTDIKARINAGTYQVDTSAFAEKLLTKMNEVR